MIWIWFMQFVRKLRVKMLRTGDNCYLSQVLTQLKML
jgi:hypothetical protein